MSSDDVRDDRIIRRRGRRNGEAVSRLCRAWTRAGGDAIADLLRVAADAAEDFNNDGDCPPRGRGRDRGGR